MRTFGKHERRIFGQQADELLPLPALSRIRARQRTLAEEVTRRLRDQSAHAEVVRGHRAVGILPDDDVTLLGTQTRSWFPYRRA